MNAIDRNTSLTTSNYGPNVRSSFFGSARRISQTKSILIAALSCIAAISAAFAFYSESYTRVFQFTLSSTRVVQLALNSTHVLAGITLLAFAVAYAIYRSCPEKNDRAKSKYAIYHSNPEKYDGEKEISKRGILSHY